jgi:ABC-type multidrug transport system ATPase subunit
VNTLHSASGITITTEGLGKRFNREWIFRNLETTFAPGAIYAVTGPNGSGKSTLLQVLWGQMPPSKGVVSYTRGGISLPAEDLFRHVAIATPYMDLIDEFTLEELLRFHFSLKQPRESLRPDDMLERMYLTPSRKKIIGNFSSGMRQRVKLALAFFTQADLVFLDEPGTNLDDRAFAWYQGELRQLLAARCTVFVASNEPAEYPAEAHKVDIMRYK